MPQSKRNSLAESLANMIAGYVIALAGQMVIFPLVGLSVNLSQNMAIGFWFALISFVRGYLIRRVFNWIDRRSSC